MSKKKTVEKDEKPVIPELTPQRSYKKDKKDKEKPRLKFLDKEFIAPKAPVVVVAEKPQTDLGSRLEEVEKSMWSIQQELKVIKRQLNKRE